MSYRVMKKCTKKTKGKCLKCEHCEVITETKIRCKANNTCFISEFNPNEYYCQEYGNINLISGERKQEMINKYNKQLAKNEIKKFVNTYYCKKDRENIKKKLLENL